MVRQLGLLYYQQGQLERAREAFTRYVEENPDAPDALRVSEYLAARTLTWGRRAADRRMIVPTPSPRKAAAR